MKEQEEQLELSEEVDTGSTRRTRNTGELRLMESGGSLGCYYSSDAENFEHLEHPEYSQTRDLESWMKTQADEDKLRDGTYAIVRVVKVVKISTVKQRTFEDVVA